MTGHSKAQQVAQYVLLPGIVPRLRDAFGFNFAFLAYAFASCFELVRLLPRHHAYLRPESYGTFGLIDVLRAAAANLVFDRKHIDQVVIFFTILTGFVLFVTFMILAALYTLMTPAYAQAVSDFWTMLRTPAPQNDVALTLLDRVLGVTGRNPATTGLSGSFFDSGAAGSFVQTPFQIALHGLLTFYCTIFFFFAFLIMIYLLVIVAYETSVTGVPFGTRFNRFWAPLRIVAALGMLIPLPPDGLNSAQYIVLYTAKFSSGFATNAWIGYNQIIKDNSGGVGNPLGSVNMTAGNVPQSNLAVKLNAPDVSNLLAFVHVAATCEYFYERAHPDWNIRGYLVHPSQPTIPAYDDPATGSATQFVSFNDALQRFNYGSIRVVFGRYSPEDYKDLPGKVFPFCGELTIPINSVDDPVTPQIDNPGANSAQSLFYNYVMQLLGKDLIYRQYMDGFASLTVERSAVLPGIGPCLWDSDANNIVNFQADPVNLNDPGNDLTELGDCRETIPQRYQYYITETYQSIFQYLVNGAYDELADVNNWDIEQDILDRGWAGAGVWFHTIARHNGTYISAVTNIPYASKMPYVMDLHRRLMMLGSAQLNGFDVLQYAQLTSNSSNGLSQANLMTEEEKKALKAIGAAYDYWQGDASNYSFTSMIGSNFQSSVTGLPGIGSETPHSEKNPIIDMVHNMMGTRTLFEFKKNNDTHPLAQLVGFGRTLLEKSMRNLATGTGIALMGGVVSVGNSDAGNGIVKGGQFFIVFASIFFVAGFTLYYVLPMLPFVFFFFAVLAWVKAIFEAMVGAPLWALAHMRLEAQGFPSGPSVGGYLLLAEIFLRPIITVFALVGAMTIYAGTIYMLNDIFDLLVYNTAHVEYADYYQDEGQFATDPQVPPEYKLGPIDEMFYNISYILLVYMLANSCFQVIDRVPNGFMRWLGGGMKSFSAEAYSRDSPSKSFFNYAQATITYPVQGIIDKADNVAAQIGSGVGGAVEAATMNKETGKGAVSEMVQNVFGRSREQQLLGGSGYEGDLTALLRTQDGKIRSFEDVWKNRNSLTSDERKKLEDVVDNARYKLSGGSGKYVPDSQVVGFLKGEAEKRELGLLKAAQEQKAKSLQEAQAAEAAKRGQGQSLQGQTDKNRTLQSQSDATRTLQDKTRTPQDSKSLRDSLNKDKPDHEPQE